MPTSIRYPEVHESVGGGHLPRQDDQIVEHRRNNEPQQHPAPQDDDDGEGQLPQPTDDSNHGKGGQAISDLKGHVVCMGGCGQHNYQTGHRGGLHDDVRGSRPAPRTPWRCRSR